MKVAFYENAFDRTPQTAELTWTELVGKLSTHRVSPRCATWPCADHRCPGKNGPAWSPVDIEGTRANENVRAVTVAVFDLDHITADEADAVTVRLEAENVSFAIHSTHKHDPLADHFSLRLAIELDRPAKPAEWPAVREAIVSKFDLPADRATKDLSRLYYLPNSVEGTEPLFYANPGRAPSVDAFKRMAPASAVRDRLLNEAEPDGEPLPVPVDLQEIAEQIRRHASPQNRALVGAALRGEGLGPKGNKNPYGGQDHALQRLMSTAAFCTEAPWPPIEHLFRPCFEATDWGEGTEHLIDQACDKFERARERKAKRDALREADAKALWEAVGMARETGPKPAEGEGEETEDPHQWLSGLIKTEEKVPKLALCERNVLLVLRNAPEWRDSLRFNQVSKQLEIKNAPDGIGSIDALDVEISMWFQGSAWGKLGLKPTPRMVEQVLRTLPQRTAYDPLRDYLEGLQWDGKPRVDTFLETYFGAHGDPVEYLRAISRRWLISLVARGLTPGVKVDTVLCLEGSQGLGKSTALRVLSEPWFCDSKIDIGNKDSWALASQFWIMELAEAEGMTKAQADALKGFFSKRDDTYRPPYGRTNSTTLRRAVFAVTTNAQQFLKFDPTGYRRYWPVTCGELNVPGLKQDRDQLLAEAVVAYRASELHYFVRGTPEATLQEAAAHKREETIGEASQDIIIDWILNLEPGKRPKHVKIADLLTNGEIFGLQRAQITRGREMELAEVLRAMGFERYTGNLGKAWKVPEHLLEAAHVKAFRGSTPATRENPAENHG